MSIDWVPLLQLAAAIVLALPTAWNREASSRIMGLRTFPLVSLGGCAYVLVGTAFLGAESPEAMSRILQGVVSGIGFVGGGAILKYENHVEGTATAAAIWITGALGAAVGFGLWQLALGISALNFLTVVLLSRLKQDIPTSAKEGD